MANIQKNQTSNKIIKSCNEKLQRFLILTKENNQKVLNLAKIVSNWLKDRGKTITAIDSGKSEEEIRQAGIESDIALVLGGDGTMLGVARALYGLDIPLLGINFGRVGFLTDISPCNWESSLTKLLEGCYEIQNVTPLWWEILRDNISIFKGIAINDVVIARARIAKAIAIGINIDDIFLSELVCDGLICSAPLGATAYAASSNGPLAFPSLDAHILTPISPFAGSFLPLVMPRESLVKIDNLRGESAVTIDGQICHDLEIGDVIHVQSAYKQISMFVQSRNWFWQRLVERGFIMPGPGTYK